MKRGSSGYSFVCGVKKEVGMTSHDVVNRVRKILGERRVGHAGTLDPAASGVLIVCAGPATRLVNYFVGHDKKYIARIQFGASTETDDAQGKIVREADVPDCVLHARFAEDYLRGLTGKQKQMPPVYSALKVGGKKACDEARRGCVIELSPRDIEVFDAKLLGVGVADIMCGRECVAGAMEAGRAQGAGGVQTAIDAQGANGASSECAGATGAGGAQGVTDVQGTCASVHGEDTDVQSAGNEQVAQAPYWDVEFHVSAGTYVRALARDIGLGVGSVAHLSALERTCVGALSLHDCASLDVLEREGAKICIDPVLILGMRVTFLDDEMASKVDNGGFLPESLKLCEMSTNKLKQNICLCTSGVVLSEARPADAEKIAVVSNNKLKAIYYYDAKIGKFKPDCVFSLGVLRGACL